MSNPHYHDFDHYVWKFIPHADRRIPIRKVGLPGPGQAGAVTLTTTQGTYAPPQAVEPFDDPTDTQTTLDGLNSTLSGFLKVYDDDPEAYMAAGFSTEPPDLQVVTREEPTGSAVVEGSKGSSPTQAEALMNKLNLGVAAVGQEYTFQFFLPPDTSIYDYSSLAYSTNPTNASAFSIVIDNSDEDNSATRFTVIGGFPGETLLMEYSYTITNKSTGETVTRYVAACYETDSTSTRLPNDMCIDNNIDKTGEVTNLAVSLSPTNARSTILPWNHSNGTEPDVARTYSSGATENIVHVQRANNGDANPWYVPVFFNDNQDPIVFAFSTQYVLEDGTIQSGSPQFTTWTHCPSGGSGSYNLLINNSAFTRTITSTDPDFVALRGLHYIRVNTVVPTKGTTAPYREVRITNFQTTLPTGWGMTSVNIQAFTIISGPPPITLFEPGGANWLVGNAPAGTEWEVEVALANNAPFDFGRSSTLEILRFGSTGQDTIEINDTDPQGITGWRTISIEQDNQLELVWLNRPVWDTASQTIKFRVRSQGGGARIRGLKYLSTAP